MFRTSSRMSPKLSETLVTDLLTSVSADRLVANRWHVPRSRSSPSVIAPMSIASSLHLCSHPASMSQRRAAAIIVPSPSSTTRTRFP